MKSRIENGTYAVPSFRLYFSFRGTTHRVTAEREPRISLDENFGTCSLRNHPRLVSTAVDSKSSPESELSALANNARRDEGIVEFTPRGVLLSS